VAANLRKKEPPEMVAYSANEELSEGLAVVFALLSYNHLFWIIYQLATDIFMQSLL
jgi:hypothetical protein